MANRHLLTATTAIILICLATGTHALTGSGTEASPYTITTCQDLQEMNGFLENTGIYFQLGGDIDCSAYGTFTPIGMNDTNLFSGKFYGNNYTITGLQANRPGYTGLFGAAGKGADISNVGLIDFNIIAPGTYGATLAGYFAGGDINNVYAYGGSVWSDTSTNYIAGLIGYLASSGDEVHDANLMNSYQDQVDVNSGTAANSGGLIGRVGATAGAATYVINNYTTGHHSQAGGIASTNPVIGTADTGTEYYRNLYFDQETVGNDTTDPQATALTTANAKKYESYSNWDFINIWKISQDQNYPTLRTGSQACLTNSWFWEGTTIIDPEAGTTSTTIDFNQNIQIAECELSAYYWKIDDANQATDQNMTYSFSTAGNYNVCLDTYIQAPAINDSNCSTVTITEATHDVNVQFDKETSGRYWWNTGTKNFTDNNILFQMEELPLGRIYSSFNNEWQQFEFDNNQAIDLDFDISILSSQDGTCEVQFRDLASGNIEGAIVEMHIADANIGDWNMAGRRFTDASGKTAFYAKSTDILKFTATKEGAETGIRTLIGADCVDTDDDTVIILSGQTTEFEQDRRFDTFTPSRTPEPVTAQVVFTANKGYTVCFNRYEDTTLVDTECDSGSQLAYEFEVDTEDVNYTVTASILGIEEARFSFVYSKPDTWMDWVLPTPIGNEETLDYFIVLFIMLIIAATLVEILFTKGTITFFIGAIYLATIPEVGLHFLWIAFLGAIYIFSSWAKEYWT